MKELDAAVEAYLDHCYEAAPEDERAAYRALLDMQDPELFYLLSGKSEASDPLSQRVIEQIHAALHAKARG
jgi:antitoxin CptB